MPASMSPFVIFFVCYDLPRFHQDGKRWGKQCFCCHETRGSGFLHIFLSTNAGNLGPVTYPYVLTCVSWWFRHILWRNKYWDLSSIWICPYRLNDPWPTRHISCLFVPIQVVGLRYLGPEKPMGSNGHVEITYVSTYFNLFSRGEPSELTNTTLQKLDPSHAAGDENFATIRSFTVSGPSWSTQAILYRWLVHRVLEILNVSQL